jgi:hypothetical protein
MNDNRLSSQGVPPSRLIQLKRPVCHRDCVVIVHRPLVLDTENPVQIVAPDAHECAAFLGCRNCKLRVELGNVTGA